MVEAYERGSSTLQLGAQLGVDPKTVGHALRFLGVDLRTGDFQVKVRWNVYVSEHSRRCCLLPPSTHSLKYRLDGLHSLIFATHV